MKSCAADIDAGLEAERGRMKAILDPLVARIPEIDFRSGDPAGIVGEFEETTPSASQLDLEIAALFVSSFGRE